MTERANRFTRRAGATRHAYRLPTDPPPLSMQYETALRGVRHYVEGSGLEWDLWDEVLGMLSEKYDHPNRFQALQRHFVAIKKAATEAQA